MMRTISRQRVIEVYSEHIINMQNVFPGDFFKVRSWLYDFANYIALDHLEHMIPTYNTYGEMAGMAPAKPCLYAYTHKPSPTKQVGEKWIKWWWAIGIPIEGKVYDLFQIATFDMIEDYFDVVGFNEKERVYYTITKCEDMRIFKIV